MRENNLVAGEASCVAHVVCGIVQCCGLDVASHGNNANADDHRKYG
jgi:hypothetical protein